MSEDTQPIAMKRQDATEYPARRVFLPCSRCGERCLTVSLYMDYAGSEKLVRGHYGDLSIRLCQGCVTEAAKVLKETQRPANGGVDEAQADRL